MFIGRNIYYLVNSV